MIDYKELRVGNLVLSDTGLAELEEHKLTLGDFADLHSGKLKEENLEPIELSEDILLRAGLEKRTNENETLTWFAITIGHEEYVISYLSGWGLSIAMSDDKTYRYLARTPYLHKLQNLIFELSGQELTLK